MDPGKVLEFPAVDCDAMTAIQAIEKELRNEQ